MPDPFDFISTRSDINDLPDILSTDLPKIDNVSLIPLVSADNRTNPETSVLDNIVNAVNLLPDNSPAYEYKAKEERRYNNPYLQFTPDTRGRGDIENVYGQYQGSGEQLLNGIIKMGALAGATFVSSYASIPSSLDLIRSGKPIEAFKDDATFSAVQNWTEGIEDQFPNYYTQWERDHPYLSIISPTGFANVWGDKVIKNIGFTVGGLAAGITQGAALEVLTGGLGTPLAFMKAAKVLEGSFGSLIRGFRNLSKVGLVGKADDVIKGLEYTKDTLEAIKATSRLNQIRTGATLAATTYLSAQGQAFIEGYHTYIDTKKQLLEEAINAGNLTPDKLNQIEKDAMDAGRYTTGLNIPLLMASNLVQFPIILGGKAFGSINKGFIKKSITKEGIKFTNDHTFRKGLKTWGRESLKGFVSEGLEEGNQYFIGNSLHDYYTDKIDPQSKKGLAEYMLNNIPKVLRDEQFQQEAFFGGLSGVAMGAPFARGRYFKTSKTQSTVDHLNNVYDNFNKGVKNFTHTVQLQDNTDNPDGKHNADIAHKALFSAVHDSLRTGTYDMHQDILEDMKHLSFEDFNKTFGTTFENENDKLSHVQGLVHESEQIKKDVINTNKYFMTNPFTQNKLLQKVKQALSSKDEYAIANAQERLFEDFKELAAFNQSRLRTVGNNLSDKITSLKTLGAKDESIQYLITIAGSPKGLNNYLQWKGVQLEALNKSIAYFEKMKGLGSDTDPNLKADMEKEYKEATKRKRFLEAYMITVQSEKDQDKVLDLILREETTGEQQLRFLESLKKTAKEAADLQAQQTNLEVEQEDLSDPESKTAEELINLNEQVGQQNTPVDNEAELVPPVEDTAKWTTKFKQGDKLPFGDKPYTINQVLEDALAVTDDKGIQYRVTNTDKGYRIDAITTSPTEQMQSQTNVKKSFNDINPEEKNRITKALENEKSNNPSRFSELKSIVDNIRISTIEMLDRANGTVFESLADVLRPLLKNVETKWYFKQKKNRIIENGNYIGLKISLNVLTDSSKQVPVFLHEAIHHISDIKTYSFVNKQYDKLSSSEIEALKNLERIYTKCKSLAGGDKKLYGFNNLAEFLTESFTDRKFQEVLKKIPGEGKHPNMFKAFIDAIAELLGISNNSILEDIFYYTEQIANKEVSEEEAYAELYMYNKANNEANEFTKLVDKILANPAPTDTQELEDGIENTIINNAVFLTPPGEENGYRSLIPISEALQNQKYKFYDLGDNLYAVVTDKITYLIDKNYPNKDGKYIVEKIYRTNTGSLSIINKPYLEIITKANGQNLEERYKRLLEARRSLLNKLEQDNTQVQEPQLTPLATFQERKEQIEKNRQKDLNSESGRIVVSTEIWEDDEGRLFRIDKLKNGKQRLSVTNEEGKLLNVIDVYDGSLSPKKFISNGKKLRNQEIRENKIADKINTKYDAQLLDVLKDELSSGKLITDFTIAEQKLLNTPSQVDPVEEYLAEPEVQQEVVEPLTTEQAEEIRGKKTEVQVFHPVTFSEQGFTYQDIIDNPGMYFSLDKVATPSGKLYTAKVVKGKATGEIVEVKFDSTMEKNKGLDKAKKPYFTQDHYKTLEFRQVLWKDSKALESTQVVPNQENEDNNANYIEMFFKDNNSTLKDSVLLLINKGMIKLDC